MAMRAMRIVVDLVRKTPDSRFTPLSIGTDEERIGRCWRLVATVKEIRPIRRPIRTPQPAAKEGPRINEEIRVREVQLIDKDGASKGVTEINAAIAMAQDAGLTLVE